MDRRAFLVRAAAAGIMAPVLTNAVVAWAEPITVVEAGQTLSDCTFVWPQRVVLAGDLARVTRCKFINIPGYAIHGLAKDAPDPGDAAITILGDARNYRIDHNHFAFSRLHPDLEVQALNPRCLWRRA